MKKLQYSITIDKPQAFVFEKMVDKSVYPERAKAWGEWMTYEGEWKKGEHISFFDQTQGGTKVVIDEIQPNESIQVTHIAMVNTANEEVPLEDDMMKKWIGSKESYFFEAVDDNTTILTVIMQTDASFQQMFDGAWPKALAYFKEVCER